MISSQFPTNSIAVEPRKKKYHQTAFMCSSDDKVKLLKIAELCKNNCSQVLRELIQKEAKRRGIK